MQLELLPASAQLLLDDATGRIEYVPLAIPLALADQAMSALCASDIWQQEQREMYGRMLAVPRLTAAFRLDDPQLPASLAQVAERLVDRLDVPFSTVGLNRYRDGNDSVAPHNDHLDELSAGHPIALVSLGQTRDMVIRQRRPRGRRFVLPLQHASLLVMSYATQLHYDHGIPKQPGLLGERISLAFRVRPRR